MSQLRTAKAGDVQAFPGSKFVIDDTPPIAQCQETEISAANGTTTAGGSTLEDAFAFLGIDLAGKVLSISAPPNNVGDYPVLSNTDSIITFTGSTPDASFNNVYTVHDAAQAYLTRNQPSFTRFIESRNQAHTTKGGQLFTDITDPPMDDACSDTFNPQ